MCILYEMYLRAWLLTLVLLTSNNISFVVRNILIVLICKIVPCFVHTLLSEETSTMFAVALREHQIKALKYVAAAPLKILDCHLGQTFIQRDVKPHSRKIPSNVLRQCFSTL